MPGLLAVMEKHFLVNVETLKAYINNGLARINADEIARTQICRTPRLMKLKIALRSQPGLWLMVCAQI